MRRTAVRPTDDRGASDALAFVFTFSLVVTSVGLVSTVGVEQLTDLRNQEQVNGAERALVSAATTFDDVARRTDPHRQAQLAVTGGTFSLTGSKLTVTYDGTSTELTVDALQHRLSGDTLTYENGAVLHTYGDQPDSPTIVRHEPAIRCEDGQYALVSVQTFTTNESETIHRTSGIDRVALVEGNDASGVLSGVPSSDSVDATTNEGVVLLTAQYNGSSTVFDERSASDPVILDVGDTTTPEAWGHFLTERAGWTAVGPSSPNEYQCDADRILVRQVNVNVTTT